MTQGITIVTKMESHDVYGGRAGDDGTNHVGNTLVGRRGWLGNPFTTDIFDRERAINLYQGVFLSRLEQDEFREAVESREPTGERYVRCSGCGVEVLTGGEENAPHRAGCRSRSGE